MFSHFKQRRLQIQLAVMAILLILIACLPIKIGDSVNKDIPIIGHAEQIASDYCDKTFKKAAAAYASAKVTDKVISTIKETRMQLTPMGLGLTIAPTEWLSAANDAIERICTLLFAITGIMLTGKLIIGMVSFISIKCLLPAAILSYSAWLITGGGLSWGKNLSRLLAKLAFALWLFFPLTALVNNHVEKAFLDKKYETITSEVESKNKKIESLGGDLQKTIAQLQSNLYLETLPAAFGDMDKDEGRIRQADWADPSDEISIYENDDEPKPNESSNPKGFTDRIKEKFSSAWNSTARFFTQGIVERASKLLALADEAADDLFQIFIMFCMTTILIPLMMIILMRAVFNSILADYQQVSSLIDKNFINTLLSTKKERAEKKGKKICPYCKHTTLPDYKGSFCPDCGRPLDLKCPNPQCKEILREGFAAKFCPHCKEKLTRCPECTVIQSANAKICTECGADLTKRSK